MKKLISLTLIAFIFLFVACEVKDPSAPSLAITKGELALNKVVAIGNSLTAGFQSNGLREDFQTHSYPYYVAQQLGKAEDFEQPLVASPGIGGTSGKTPLKFENGQIVDEDLTVDPTTLLKNATLSRPYDNLGVPGATLDDVLTTTSSSNSTQPGNAFFDMILRNPNFGNTTQLQQAITLNPTLILLWIGNNDVLGAALDGGNMGLITPQQAFQTKFTSLLTELRENTDAAIVMANIPHVTNIPYTNTLDVIFHTSPGLGINTPVPVVFDETLQPVDFSGGDGLYVPLLTAETDVSHLLLPALSAYQQGMGVPDSAALVGMGLPSPVVQQLVAGMRASGLNPTGTPFPGNFSLTTSEINTISSSVDGFNTVLNNLANQFQVAVLDANSMLTTLNTQGIDGYSGRFVLLDPANTAFSLDGVHLNHGGYALVANAFIETINQAMGVSIPQLNTDQYKGQYLTGAKIKKLSMEAIANVSDLFVPQQK